MLLRPRPDRFWHATPLHYVPHILQCGGLYAQDELAARRLPVRPRVTATRRDRKLGLAGYVHLSFEPHTPLLADKRARGFLHALFAFEPGVAERPDAAMLAYNPKSWRHRDDFAPVTAPEDRGALLEAWQRGRYPSAELLVPRELPLDPLCDTVYVATPEEADWLRALTGSLGIGGAVVIRATPGVFPPGPPPELSAHVAYADACRSAGVLLPPPDLPFD